MTYYATLAAKIKAAGLPADTSVFDLYSENVIVLDTKGDNIVVAVTHDAIREDGWVPEDEIDTAYDRGYAQAREDAGDERDNLLHELRTSLDSLLRAAEYGRLEDQVSSTDLLLHGPAVAAVRDALAIVEDVFSEYAKNAEAA